MKNKSKTYLLLVAVLIIWGTIAVKIWNGFLPDDQENVTSMVSTAFNPQKPKQVDTFSIAAYHRDPFLGKLKAKKQKIKKPKVIITPPEIDISIQFNGEIAQTNGKDKIYIITISDQQYLMKKGQSIKGLKLIQADGNRAKVSYKGIKKTISKL